VAPAGSKWVISPAPTAVWSIDEEVGGSRPSALRPRDLHLRVEREGRQRAVGGGTAWTRLPPTSPVADLTSPIVAAVSASAAVAPEEIRRFDVVRV
jgi:hypothetical protein